MATEVGQLIVELEARVSKLEAGLNRGRGLINQFSRRARGAFRSVSGSIRRLVTRFTGVTAALAAIASVASFTALVQGSVQASAAIETFTIRLQNLIGSTRLTQRTLGNLRDFATRVAPPLEEIIEAAATLGTVALGSATEIEALTGTAANIAAVTGLTLEQSAQNLQRALSAGIGAADLFRERGVRAVLEALTGIPNLIDQPISVVRRAFEDVFGPDGTFGEAAEQFATTLPGAISVSRDAFFNFRAALGDALRPGVLGGLREILIPTLERLTELVDENRDEIGEFARRGVVFAARALALFTRAMVASIQVASRLREGVIGLRGAFAEFQLGRAQRRLASLRGDEGGPALGSPQEIARAEQALAEAQETVNRLTTDFRDATIEGERFRREIGEINVVADLLERNAANLGESTAEAIRQSEEESQRLLNEIRDQLTGAIRVDPQIASDTESAINRQVDLLDRRAAAAARASDPLDADIVRLQQANAELEENLALTSGVIDNLRQQVELAESRTFEDPEEERGRLNFIERATERINELETERAGILQRTAEAQAQIQEEIASIERRRRDLTLELVAANTALVPTLEALRELDEPLADSLVAAAQRQLENADSLEERVRIVLKLLDDVNDSIEEAREDLEKPLSDTIGGAISSSISSALADVARGQGFDFAQTLADLSGDLLESSLRTVFDDLAEDFNTFLEDIFGAGQSALGSVLGGALGIAGALVGNILQGDDQTVRFGNVQTAVDQTRQVRGVVAGPTQIGIFEVGNAIQDAFVETNAILLRILDAEERQISALGARGAGSAGGDASVDQQAARILSNNSASLP